MRQSSSLSGDPWNGYAGSASRQHGLESPVWMLFAEHGESALNFAYRMIGRQDRAESVTQQSLLGVTRRHRGPTSKTALARSLYREIMRRCLEEDPAASDDGVPCGQGITGRVERALRSLPCEARAAILLSRIDGFDTADVAECLEASVDATSTLLRDAGHALAAELGDLLE
jgi:DNA-directed RNA polymerase specialized sigma24 family protein